MTSYDEDLAENPFFRAFTAKCPQLYEVAVDNEWMICVPRLGSASRLSLSRTDFESHLLVPGSPDDEEKTFVTPNAKKVKIEGDIITTAFGFEEQRSVRILFQETNYSPRDKKYHVLCIDCPLEGELSAEPAVATLTSLEDCVQFLWPDNAGASRTQKQIDKLLKLMGPAYQPLESRSLRNIVDVVSAVFSRAIQTILKDSSMRKLARQNRAYMENVKLAVETYVMDRLHAKTFPSVCALLTDEDAALNKITRSLSNIRQEDLGLKQSQCQNVGRARREMSQLNKFTTPLEKLYCLRRTILALSSTSSLEEDGMTADDLLPLLILLVIKSDIPNWIGNMSYMLHLSARAASEELVFVLSSFEAAVQHVKDGHAKTFMSSGVRPSFQSHVSEAGSQSQVDVFFQHVRQNSVDTVKKLLSDTQQQSDALRAQMCHPLCSCEKCQRLLSGEKENDPMAVAVNSRDDLGCTALHIAAELGHLDMVQLLIDREAVVKSTDYHGTTALHLACQQGHQAPAMLLINNSADVNATDNEGNAPLHLACFHGHEECAKALVFQSKVCNVNAANEKGDTPLHLSARWGYESLVELLLKNGASVEAINRHKETPLQCTHNQRVVEMLEKEVSERRDSASGFVHIQASDGEQTPASQTHDDRVHPNAGNFPDGIEKLEVKLRDRRTPSPGNVRKQSAESKRLPETSKNRKKTSKSKSEPKDRTKKQAAVVDVDVKKEVNLLLKACSDGDVQMVKYKLGWVDDGPSVAVVFADSDLCHPLCQCPKCQELRAAANRPVLSVESVNEDGMTPLHVAALHGKRHVVQDLLRHSAPVNAKNNSKQTPLHLACQYNHQDVVMLLVDYKARVSVKDANGCTPLHSCCSNGHDASAAILLFHGANVNAADKRGNTPLHNAAKWGHLSLVNTLLLHGSLPTIKNAQQLLAIQLAQDDEVQQLLERAQRGEVPVGSFRRRNSFSEENKTGSKSPQQLQVDENAAEGHGRSRGNSFQESSSLFRSSVSDTMSNVHRDVHALTFNHARSENSGRSSPALSDRDTPPVASTTNAAASPATSRKGKLINSMSSSSSAGVNDLLQALEDKSLAQLEELSAAVRHFDRRQSLRSAKTNDRSKPNLASTKHQFSIIHFDSTKLRKVLTRDGSRPQLFASMPSEDKHGIDEGKPGNAQLETLGLAGMSEMATLKQACDEEPTSAHAGEVTTDSS